MLLDDVPLERHDDHLPHFDYSTQLGVSRRIEVDFEAMASSIGHDPESLMLECLVFAGSGGARLARSRNIVARHRLSHEASSVSIDVSIESKNVSRWLILTTELVLKSGHPKTRLAPSIIGSRLWSEERRLSVEPTGSRFPVEVVGFSSVLGKEFANALWFLEWSINDLSLEFVSAVRLYVNADTPSFIERVHDADDVTVKAITAGISAQMIRAAVSIDAFDVDGAHYAPSTLGGVIYDWMERCFPGQTPTSVRTMADFDPGRFEAIVSGSLGSLGEA